MKTIIAALALSVAASTAAFAGVDEPRDAGIALVLQHEAAASGVQVSGFTGVGEFMPASDTPREGGLPLVSQGDYNQNVFGFTGIQEAPSYIIPTNGDNGSQR